MFEGTIIDELMAAVERVEEGSRAEMAPAEVVAYYASEQVSESNLAGVA